MRVLAARFPDRDRASALRDMLSRTLHVSGPDVSIAPLGVPGREATDTLLAGRFSDESAPAVAAMVRECGGEIVANVDESWTRPRSAPEERPAWSPAIKRGGLHA